MTLHHSLPYTQLYLARRDGNPSPAASTDPRTNKKRVSGKHMGERERDSSVRKRTLLSQEGKTDSSHAYTRREREENNNTLTEHA